MPPALLQGPLAPDIPESIFYLTPLEPPTLCTMFKYSMALLVPVLEGRTRHLHAVGQVLEQRPVRGRGVIPQLASLKKGWGRKEIAFTDHQLCITNSTPITVQILTTNTVW